MNGVKWLELPRRIPKLNIGLHPLAWPAGTGLLPSPITTFNSVAKQPGTLSDATETTAYCRGAAALASPVT